MTVYLSGSADGLKRVVKAARALGYEAARRGGRAVMVVDDDKENVVYLRARVLPSIVCSDRSTFKNACEAWL